MKFLLSLAWKNISRYKRRTMITACALAVGIAVYIWLDGWLLGIEMESERNLIWYETASAKIMHRDYFEEIKTLPLKYVIEAPLEVEERLEASGVSFTRRTAFVGELFYGEGAMQVKVIGIDPETDERVFRMAEVISGGRYLKRGEQGMMIGEWLADDLGAKVGEPVIIRTRTRYGAFQTIELDIVGILNCPNPLINKGTAFIPLSIVEDTLQMEGAVSELALLFPEWRNVKALEYRVENIKSLIIGYPELTVQSWRDLAKDYLMFAKMKSSGSSIYLFLVFIIAAVGISNTMLMAVYERVKEIGMMRALGMKDSSIRISFLFEAGAIGLIGSLIGVALGAIINFFMVRWGIDYSGILGDMNIGYRVLGVFRSAWNPRAMVGGPVFGILASMVISFIPSSRALRMGITDCLRYE